MFEESKVISNVRHFGASKGKSGYAGGMLTTAGELVFYGSETGQFQAMNASTGDICTPSAWVSDRSSARSPTS